MNRVFDSSFAREVLSAAVPVLVTFVSDDCAPCRSVLSLIEQLARDATGLKYVTIDVAHNPESRAIYNIHGLPTLAVFAGGEIVARRVGSPPDASDLSEWVAAAIERGSR
jgi:thioredoxin 1